MKYLALAAALVFAACSPSAEKPADMATPEQPPAAGPGAPPVGIENALTENGWGPLRIGMTRAEIVAAVGDNSVPGGVGGPEPELCDEFHPARAPEGLYVMIEEGKLSRITAAELSTVKTDKGLGLGDTADAVKAAYGDKAKASPHKYQDKPAEYVTVWSGGPRSEPYVQDETARGIVYEIDGTGRVGAIHAGGPSIQYVEGCA